MNERIPFSYLHENPFRIKSSTVSLVILISPLPQVLAVKVLLQGLSEARKQKEVTILGKPLSKRTVISFAVEP